MDKLSADRPIEKVLAGQVLDTPPVWFMRQAGRHLVEYKAVRAEAGSFLELCYNPVLAAVVTLQPVNRYDLDAAILFSDILIVPHAMGQDLTFAEGEGPRLPPVTSHEEVKRLGTPTADNDKFACIYETVARTRAQLASNKTLLGFCGAPWTVATYMVAGRGTPDQADAKAFAANDPEGFQALVDHLVAVSVDYLSGQVDAGADAVQIFDTWAGSLKGADFDRWVIAPTRAIVDQMRARYPGLKIIGFPRGAGDDAARYVTGTGVDGIGCEPEMPFETMQSLSDSVVVQGNLSPDLLLEGGSALDAAVDGLLDAMKGRRHIFNLGHGVMPPTPPAHVARVVARVRASS